MCSAVLPAVLPELHGTVLRLYICSHYSRHYNLETIWSVGGGLIFSSPFPGMACGCGSVVESFLSTQKPWTLPLWCKNNSKSPEEEVWGDGCAGQELAVQMPEVRTLALRQESGEAAEHLSPMGPCYLCPCCLNGRHLGASST